MVGRHQVVMKNPHGENQRIASMRSESTRPTNSTKRQWSERVKHAAPADFPRLLEEWSDLFPESEDGNDVQRDNALHWLFAQWLVQDPDGFTETVTSEDFNWSHAAAPVIVQLNPDLALRLLNSSEHSTSRDFYKDFLINNVAEALAITHPLLYLELNPDGTRDFTPDDHGASDAWQNAIAALAQSDPVAAANAWQKRKMENNASQVLESLFPVLAAWKDDDSSIKIWVNQIENTALRELAQHARLMTLAKKDAHAALAELYTTHLLPNNDLRETGTQEVLIQLTEQDLPAAMRLLKETSPLFALPEEDFEVKSDSGFATSDEDPFADPFAPAPVPPPTGSPTGPPPNPFIALAPYMGNTPDDNWMRDIILAKASKHLPENPYQLIAALHQLRSEMGGDNPWQRKIEAELIRKASGKLSIESSIALIRIWNNELGGIRDDETYQSLTSKIAACDPDEAEAVLESLPESARAAFAAEIVKNLPPEDAGRRIRLFEQLTPAQWDDDLGKSLGEHPADFADAIAALPGTTTAGSRKAFMEKWVETDPDAATRWFSSLPKDEAAGSAAVGLFEGWSSYDKSSAVAWAESLPDSPARQAVALDAVHAIAAGNPGDAWRWAASITNPTEKAKAHNVISALRDDEPAEFKKEHKAALHAAGME